jgi:hypothetical protein
MQQSNFFALHKAKVPGRENIPIQIAESPHLNTMVASYYKHFTSYSRGKKQLTQLILVVVWKQVYIYYQLHHINSVFVKTI